MPAKYATHTGQETGVRKSGIPFRRSAGTEIFRAGKQWKAPATPNKNPALRNTFSKRIAKDKKLEATKALEKQLEEERKQVETVNNPHATSFVPIVAQCTRTDE